MVYHHCNCLALSVLCPSSPAAYLAVMNMSSPPSRRTRKRLRAQSHSLKTSKIKTEVAQIPTSQDVRGSPSQSCSARNPRVIVAIDLGTTFTSIAYRISTWSEHVQPVILSNFPGDLYTYGADRQMPTVICYSNPGSKAPPLVGFDAQNLFTSRAAHPDRAVYSSSRYVERAKLLLYKSDHTLESEIRLANQLDRLRRVGAIDENHHVVRDILIACFKYLKKVLQEHHGITDDCEGMSSPRMSTTSPNRFVIS